MAAAIYNSNISRASHTKRYLTQIAEGQGRALYQVDDQLAGRRTTVFPDKGPYETALRTSIYDVPNDGMAGLGDSDGSGSSAWANVGTAFAFVAIRYADAVR